MKKKLRSLFIVASLSLAASLAIIACGDGVPEVLGDFLQDLGVSENYMNDKIEDVMQQTPEPPPPPPPPVSSEQPPVSSAEPIPGSSAAPPNPPVSSAAPGVSSAGGTSSTTTPSSSSVPKSSAAALAGNCKIGNEKAGFDCSWDGYSASKVLTPGTMLKPATAAPPSGCTIKWNYAPDTTGLAINYDCHELPATGVSALGSSRYVLFAELTCDDGKHINACKPKDGWSSKKAPELSGKCTWDKNPPDVTSARGAKPSGVSVVDTDGICGTTKNIVYKYDNQSKTWPDTGILPEWKNWGKDKSEIYKVEAVLNCPAYSQTVAMACPDLKVSGGVEHSIECTCGSGGQCQVNADICKADGVAKKNTVNLTTSECVEVTVYKYNNEHYLPDVGMRCASSNNTDFVVSVNGKSTTVKGNGLVPIGKLKVEEETSLGTLCLTSGASPISCSGPGQ